MTRIVITADGTEFSSEDPGNKKLLRGLEAELRDLAYKAQFSGQRGNSMVDQAQMAQAARWISALTAVTGARDLSRHDFNGAILKGDFTGTKFHRGYMAGADLTEADTTDAEVVVMSRSATLTAKYNAKSPPTFLIYKDGAYQTVDAVVDPATNLLDSNDEPETTKILKEIAFNAFRRGIVQTHTNARLDIPAESPLRKYFYEVPQALREKAKPTNDSLPRTAPIEQAYASLKDTKWHEKRSFLHMLEHDPGNNQETPSYDHQLHIARVAFSRGVEIDHPAYHDVVARAKAVANDPASVPNAPAVVNG